MRVLSFEMTGPHYIAKLTRPTSGKSNGQRYGEGGALPTAGAFSADVAMMKVHDMAHNGKTKSETRIRSCIAAVRLYERIEHSRQEFGFYSDSGIRDLYLRGLVC
jgi:hypothetical protein